MAELRTEGSKPPVPMQPFLLNRKFILLNKPLREGACEMVPFQDIRPLSGPVPVKVPSAENFYCILLIP